MAMMNADLISPESLISLRRIGELRSIVAQTDGSIRVAWPPQRQVIYLADAATIPIAFAEFAL